MSLQGVSYGPQLSHSKSNNFTFLGEGYKPFCQFLGGLFLNPLLFYGNHQMSLQRFSYKNLITLIIIIVKNITC